MNHAIPHYGAMDTQSGKCGAASLVDSLQLGAGWWKRTTKTWNILEPFKHFDFAYNIQGLVQGFESGHSFGATTPAQFVCFFNARCSFFCFCFFCISCFGPTSSLYYPDLLTELCPSKPNVDSAGHAGTTTSSWFNATSPALTRWVRYKDDRI